MLKIKYRGRTFTNERSFANAMARDLSQEVERKVRFAASGSGLRVRKTSRGLQIEGTVSKMNRFHSRLVR